MFGRFTQLVRKDSFFASYLTAHRQRANLKIEKAQPELPRGDEMDDRKCRLLVDGKECGFALTLIERELETGTRIYERPLGHRTYVPLEPEVVDSS